MTDSEREKIKLRATYLNGVALLGLGGLGPLFSFLVSGGGKSIWVALIWLWAGGMSSWEMHGLAMRQLDKLKVDSA